MREPRQDCVEVDRNTWRAIVWILAAHVIENFQGWTGWQILVAFSMAAYGGAAYWGLRWLFSTRRHRGEVTIMGKHAGQHASVGGKNATPRQPADPPGPQAPAKKTQGSTPPVKGGPVD